MLKSIRFAFTVVFKAPTLVGKEALQTFNIELVSNACLLELYAKDVQNWGVL